MDVKMLSVDEIGLSNRSRNALCRAGIFTVGEMLQFTEETLQGIRNLGGKSVEEILSKIEEYKQGENSSLEEQTREVSVNKKEIEDYDSIRSYLKKEQIKIDELSELSTRAYNLLLLGGYTYLYQIIFLKEDELLQIPRMDRMLSQEIAKLCEGYFYKNKERFIEAYKVETKKEEEKKKEEQSSTLYDFLTDTAYYERILKYVKINDCEIEQMGLSNRARNQLRKNGFMLLSDFIFKSRKEFECLPAMGTTTVNEIMIKIRAYWEANEDRIYLLCNGDESVYWSDDTIEKMILNIYQEVRFGGLNLKDIVDRLQLPETVTLERIKKIIGKLLANKELEYVDFRCYRIYEKFEDYLFSCQELDERERNFIQMRLQGATLEQIGQEYGITRERVRQVVVKTAEKVKKWYFISTNKHWFDEDYYRYFFENYQFDKNDAVKWLGIESYVFRYLEMMNVKQGKKDIHEALNDHQNIEAGLRLKIKNYINRNKIYLDGMWIEKRRSDLEAFLVRKLCTESMSFSEFVQKYNAFLENEEIPFDENIYCTDAVLYTRKNRLMEARFLLWKQNEQIRYYDIDGRDYTELLDVLNFDAYENIEFSTLKFMKEYPEIMQKYDIRDQYELHNLLRKVIPEGSYNGFHCSKMPAIRFGTFDRINAFVELLMEYAPIGINDFADLIHKEYGYDQAVIMSTYLKPLSIFYHQGIYSIDQKQMSEEHARQLQAELTKDFYFIDEIKSIYKRVIADADIEEINPYNLKKMGFIVFSRYVVQNYPSLEAYFEHLLTCEDMIDISIYRKRFTTVTMFSQTLMRLKRELKIIEFEPNQILTFKKLEDAGITKEVIQEFCDSVYDFVKADTYFSVKSIQKAGFESELFEYGFTDWFYANLLLSDKRFSFANMYRNLIFYKGIKDISIKSFEMAIIQEHHSIDVYDLISELTELYGCTIADKSDIIYKIQGTEVFYDKILDRLYANIEIYYRELDEMEEF